jgi:hypothetical protein
MDGPRRLYGNALQPLLTEWHSKVSLEGMLTRLQTALKIEAIAEPYIKEEPFVILKKQNCDF